MGVAEATWTPCRGTVPTRGEGAAKALQPHPLLLSWPKSRDKSGGHMGSAAAHMGWDGKTTCGSVAAELSHEVGLGAGLCTEPMCC